MSARADEVVSAGITKEVEVLAKAVRRQFTAEHKLRILREADADSFGQFLTDQPRWFTIKHSKEFSHITIYEAFRTAKVLVFCIDKQRGSGGMAVGTFSPIPSVEFCPRINNFNYVGPIQDQLHEI